MNKINEKQNQEKILKYLVAQRFLYSTSKKKYSLSFILGIVISIMGLIPYITQKYEMYLVVISSINLVFSFIMNNISKNKRNLAVDFQEYIDRSLFEFKIDKNTIKNLNKLDNIANDIIIDNREYYNKQIDPNNNHGVYNWYSDVSPLKLDIARIVCQNENIRWENRQRGLYSKIILGIITCIAVVYGIKIFILNQSIINFCCVFPLIFEFAKVLYENIKVIKSIGKAEEIIGDLYIDIEQKKDKYSNRKFKEKSLDIQKCINEYRQNNIAIPDFIYNKMKAKEQRKSTEFTTAKIENILNSISA